MSAPNFGPGIEITGRMTSEYAEILTPAAVAFAAGLQRKFGTRRDELLSLRAERQKTFDAGKLPDFLGETRSIREASWTCAAIPDDIQDRRVEITGPVDRKMIINALNSGASVFMADFEDANTPSWDNNIQGHLNLRDAIRRKIDYVTPEGKPYKLQEKTATLFVRPRGWHLPEKHVTVDGKPISGGIFDFALYFFHNAKALLERGSGPYFYLPKLESAAEAAWWNDVFVHAANELGFPRGVIKATVLIETLPAAFQMDEILHALREHAAGLNCGRWDYIFSFIKTRRNDPNAVLPDRAQVGMTQPCMRAYTQLVIRTCHHRGAFAMGGMAAQIPVRNDPAGNAAALERVRADKVREAADGHDGTWVAHPALVSVAREAFAANMTGDNQLGQLREDVNVTAADLLQTPTGTRTEEGVRLNVRVGLQYIEAWLRGNGAVPLYNMMEDAATAEISRTQLWQWIAHRATLDDGRVVTREIVQQLVPEELVRIRTEIGDESFRAGRFDDARALFLELVLAEELDEFLTLRAYPLLDDLTPRLTV